MVRGRAKKAARSSARSVVAKKGAVTRKLREARRRFFPDTYHGRDLRSRHVLSAFIADSSPEYLEFLQSVENIVSFDIAKNWWMSPKVGAR